MKKRKDTILTKALKRIFFSFLLLGLTLFSCKDKNEISSQSFELSVETDNGIDFHFSWNQLNISSFKDYVLVKSDSPLPNSIDFNFTSIPGSIIETISDQEINFLDVEMIPGSNKIYFQIFVRFANRFIQSNQVEIEIDNYEIIPNRANIVIVDQSQQNIIIQDTHLDKLIRYNYLTKSIEKEIDYTQEISRGIVGQYNGVSELYIVIDDNELRILDAVTFEEKEIINPSGSNICDIEVNDKGMLALSMEYPTQSILLYDRTELVLLNSIDFITFPACSGVSFLSKSENKMIGMSPEGLDYFQVDDFGQLIDQQQFPSFLEFLNLDNIVTSPNGNYFIASREGLLWNNNFERIGELFDNTNLKYADFVFTADENFMYVIANEASLGLELIKYKLPSLEIERSIQLPFEPKRVFIEDEKVFVVGRVFGNQQTIVQSFDL